MLSDPIITLLIASSSAIVALALKLCYSSRCTTIKCFKCCEINRDTEHEINIELATPTRNVI